MRTGTRWVATALTAGLVLTATSAEAHFYLASPVANNGQDNQGNPQKSAPCGGTDAPVATVTPYQAGTTLTITLDETVFHPGHYRVALAVNDPSELPAAPPVTASANDECAMTEIQDPPVFPILADGELAHTSPFGGPQTIEVTLPTDVTCDNCTLQVIEFMSNHGAPCFYYHCANIAIQQEPVMTTSSSVGSGATTGAGSGGGSNTSGAGGSTGTGLMPIDSESEEGCSCSVVGLHQDERTGYALLGLAGIGLLLASRRRRH